MAGHLRASLRAATLAGALGVLAACASHQSGGGWVGARGGHGTAPPGPASDPWGPYIREASGRFHLPERWVRAVMRQESGGHQYLNGRPTTSWAGAAGLMQVMPGTYAELAARYDLGPDPYDPHDNIIAGVAYMRELYDKYGSPGFLAAYNAGPGRMDSYLAHGGSLPSETVNYVASISPNLGDESPEAGATSTVAAVPVVEAPAPPRRQYAAAAPDLTPIAPSYVEPVPEERPAPIPEVTAAAATGAVPAPAPALASVLAPALAPQPAPAPVAPTTASSLGRAAVLANSPAATAPPVFVAPAVPRAAREPIYRLVAGKPYADMISGAAVPSRPASGPWAIQVGAFSSAVLARLATEGARQGANLLGGDATVTRVTTAKGATFYRARLEGLNQAAARTACTHLRAIGSVCDVITPGPGT